MIGTCIANDNVDDLLRSPTLKSLTTKRSKNYGAETLVPKTSIGTTSFNVLSQTINLILIWGCRPTDGVKANTQMVKDIKTLFTMRYDRNTLALNIPKVFDQMKA